MERYIGRDKDPKPFLVTATHIESERRHLEDVTVVTEQILLNGDGAQMERERFVTDVGFITQS